MTEPIDLILYKRLRDDKLKAKNPPDLEIVSIVAVGNEAMEVCMYDLGEMYIILLTKPREAKQWEVKTYTIEDYVNHTLGDVPA
jgi:hypothetical protein